MKIRRFPVFGPHRVMVADQGKEFVSWAFERLCSEHSTLLWRSAVQAPWQNGLCERSGGILKAVLSAIAKSKSIQGSDEMNMALQEAVTAYNHDINDNGVSPSQAALEATKTSRRCPWKLWTAPGRTWPGGFNTKFSKASCQA